MQSFFTPEELAEQLKVAAADVMALINEGRLQAIRIGGTFRIPEEEIEKMIVTCAAVPRVEEARPELAVNAVEALPEGSRWCPTRTRRAKFKVSGSVLNGAEIWPGQMRYPIRFPKDFMEKMLVHFRTGEFPVGGKFDDPGCGSLGEFIQHELKIKMNPAVYLAALLIDEGYAEETRRGHIRLIPTPL